MEARKITVVSTRNSQEKKTFMSSATTLGELKTDLTANGIDYNGLTFYEGLSKTEIISDDSILPSNIPYRGNVTNELVFMLTVPNKKIKSGAVSRKELYEVIQNNHLQEEIKQVAGKNYTNCNTEFLSNFVDNALKKCNVTGQVEDRFTTLIKILYKKGVLSNQDITTLHVSTEECSTFSDQEIKDMFEFIPQ